MKRIGVQGIFTRGDLQELISILSEKGAKYAALSYGDKSLNKTVDADSLANGLGKSVSAVWLNTHPFVGELSSEFNIGYVFPGSFGIQFDGCDPKDGQLGESVVSTFTPASGEQLKIWESGLRAWKKRIVRDVHVFSRKINRLFPNDKLNVSLNAIAGYERGEWLLVSTFPGKESNLVHPIAAKCEVPFPL